MGPSFYTGAAGVIAQQQKINVIGNNISNVSTEGFKTSNAEFSDLLYDVTVRNEKIIHGLGNKLKKTDTVFGSGILTETKNENHFAILGEGFFKIHDRTNNTFRYTRSGTFQLSEFPRAGMFLTTNTGDMVLDENSQYIRVDDPDLMKLPGIFDFPVKDRMQRIENTSFLPNEINGQEFINTESELKRGFIESSNVNLAAEMSKMIETQRAFTLALKVVNTSDEIEQLSSMLR